MRSFKKKWMSELDSKLPPLREDVLNEPIPPKPASELSEKTPTAPFGSRRLRIIAGALAVFLLAVGLIPLLRGMSGGVSDKTGVAYPLTVEINPAVTFLVGEDGNVTAAKALNADADVILSSDGFSEAVIGKSAEEAVNCFVDFAARLGYLPDEGGAVRLTTCTAEAEQSVSALRDSVESHLCEDGILALVFNKTLSNSEYGALNGVEESAEQGITESINGLSRLFCERDIEKLTSDALAEKYNGLAAVDQLISEVVSSILEQIGDIAAMYRDLFGIVSQNKLIIVNPHNPIVLGDRDYWSVIASDKELSPQIKERTDDMAELLENFSANYGITVDSADALSDLTDKFFSLGIDDIEAFFESPDVDSIFSVFDNLLELLELIGKDVTEYRMAMKIPETPEEFREMSEAALNKMFIRLDKGKEDKPDKEQITDSGLKDFIDGIMNSHGSADEFWDSQKPNDKKPDGSSEKNHGKK